MTARFLATVACSRRVDRDRLRPHRDQLRRRSRPLRRPARRRPLHPTPRNIATKRSARRRTPRLQETISICSPATCCCSTAWASRPSRRIAPSTASATPLRCGRRECRRPSRSSSNTEDLKDGDYYTAFAMPGDGHGPNLRIVSDHLDSPASGKARLRVVHAGTDAGHDRPARRRRDRRLLFDDVAIIRRSRAIGMSRR